MPLLKAEDVIPHLGRPTHWKKGRSARSLAESWFGAVGVPQSMQVLLDSTPKFRHAKLVDGWLERKTDLGDGCGAPSQTDLLALIDLGDELAVLAIEAKVDESFGDFVGDWLADGSLNKHKRLFALCARLGIDPDKSMRLRYQLLHRTAAALIEAKRFHTQNAVLAVQSFCPKATGFGDFAAFCDAVGFGTVERGRLSGPVRCDGIDLWVGWQSDHACDQFFARPENPDFPSLEETRPDLQP